MVEVARLSDASALTDLAATAAAEGHRMVARLITEWPLSPPEEVAYVALSGGAVVGVCALTRDPYASEERNGRVRRLYVAPGWRRRQVGTSLVETIARTAIGYFSVLRVRTTDPGADRFYRALGFAPVDGDPHCTHARAVS